MRFGRLCVRRFRANDCHTFLVLDGLAVWRAGDRGRRAGDSWSIRNLALVRQLAVHSRRDREAGRHVSILYIYASYSNLKYIQCLTTVTTPCIMIFCNKSLVNSIVLLGSGGICV